MKFKPDHYDDRGLAQLERALSGPRLPCGRLGVIGQKVYRKDAGPTNAEIGAKHELGLDGMPMRSWLRIPIIDELQKYLEKAGAFTKQSVKRVIKEGSIKPWLERVMITAERVVADGFGSGGFGKWKPSDMTHKKNHQTLVETQQLRNSVTSEVKGG